MKNQILKTISTVMESHGVRKHINQNGFGYSERIIAAQKEEIAKLKEQLESKNDSDLSSISQQRELLEDYARNLKYIGVPMLSEDDVKISVAKYLSSNSD